MMRWEEIRYNTRCHQHDLDICKRRYVYAYEIYRDILYMHLYVHIYAPPRT
jgi:hypothetical protein